MIVVVVGPQAAGKSTVSGALASDLRLHGETVALVELDQIAAMALPTLPNWDVALEIFASVTAQWATTGVTCVVAEGVGSLAEVTLVRATAPRGAPVLTAAMTASLSSAYERAQHDPSRGVSKKYPFLAGVYEAWTDELPRLAADVVIDSDTSSVYQAVSLLRDAINNARASP